MKYLLANWKMHTTVEQAVALVQAIQQGLRERVSRELQLPNVIVCPPFVSLVPLAAVVDKRLVRLGAQNCHWKKEGPHTGEISPVMLTGLAQYVLVGHSERRAAGESDEQIAKKVAVAAEVGLTPILFVGEDEPGAGARLQTEHRLTCGISRIDIGRQAVLVVYEPAWAIGADRAADVQYVGEMGTCLKDLLRRLGARDPQVLYGGTVKKDNIEQFARLDVLDGVGATRASLDAQEFLTMIDRMCSG
ncbi:MAG: triose-phosphate isomerase [Actinomycetota bacterium]|nr:triose-phosphate isomerase [Actinomycetota bacterium]MDQ3899241.1 triose-phosphate isomerase [Actinomycetota bacterium]